MTWGSISRLVALLSWLGPRAGGRFPGRSFRTGRPVLQAVSERLPGVARADVPRRDPWGSRSRPLAIACACAAAARSTLHDRQCLPACCRCRHSCPRFLLIYLFAVQLTGLPGDRLRAVEELIHASFGASSCCRR